ncbi:enoyl-CoA hydratase/isomerase family protein [Viridibacillus arvi]|uniref:Enoyl-CoA hydratase n=1 Tax=Viridibacillus arvi TaxID=263475 RepID=A0A0M0LKU7_9BACL|nr:enoyl-CoA hydratase [Viridibacillus arvi]KOO51616.1 enoyl-CoA hydratase [Viridibacillus arvi]
MENCQFVYWHKEGKVAIITIDNPPLNVLSIAVADQLKETVEQIECDPGICAVIVTGAGERAFMAGGDIKSFLPLLGVGVDKVREFALRIQEPLNLLDSLDRPVIAAINGFALGGGCELALASDIRIAEEQIQIGLPEITLGILPGAGGTQRLSRLIGSSKAKELMFTGERLSAEEAKQIGLVNHVVPKGKALVVALEIATRISQHSITALSRIKRCVDEGMHLPLREGLRLEVECLGEVFQTDNARESIQAFIEKRPARF